ncbi:MAG: DHH family phosphoesterase [Cytophagales bacterium]
MNIYKKIELEILAADHIIITSHKSPDGDSIGSSLGLYHFVSKLGKTAKICHPDPAPDYLLWVEDVDKIATITKNKNEVESVFAKADLIFCLDYNATDRVGDEMQLLLETSKAKKIMIDHHLNPQDFALLTVSDTSVCSTSQLIYELIDQSGNIDLLDEKIGAPLYLGILTDTGSFRFPSVQPRTHSILANLLSNGVKHHLIHENLNDSNTLSRLQLQGFAINTRLEILPDYKIGIIALTEADMKQFDCQKGDTDGLPNVVLSIKGMKAAVLFVEKVGIIKISFRSKGKENPVNILATEHFDGGGHANASGGKSELTMAETLEKIKGLIPMYFAQNA